MEKPDTGEMKLPTPPPPPSRDSVNPQTMSAEEKARILAETEKAMAEEVRRSARLQLVQDASDEFKKIQKEAKSANAEASEHNDVLAGRRRLMLIISAVAIGVGIALKTVELTVMGGW